MKQRLIALLFFIPLLLSQVAYALDEDQKKLVEAGNVVLVPTKVKGEVWPRLEGQLKLEGTPLECVATYYALSDQKDYIPKMKVSEPVLQISPTVVHTRYVLDMPWPIEDTEYINASSVEKDDNGNYLVKWWKIKNPTAELVEGSAKFETYKQDNTCLVTYKSFVRPDSFFAGVVKKLMVKDVKASLEAIKEFHHKTLKNKSKISKYKSLITKALSGQFVYDPAPRKSQK